MSMHLLKKLKLDVENMQKEITVETITNTNGTAKKFSDGTMICYSQQRITTKINQTWEGNSWYISQPIVLQNFPVAFVDIPMVFIGAQTIITAAVSILYQNGATKTTPNIIVLARGTASESVTVDINVCAIGRWK